MKLTITSLNVTGDRGTATITLDLFNEKNSYVGVYSTINNNYERTEIEFESMLPDYPAICSIVTAVHDQVGLTDYEQTQLRNYLHSAWNPSAIVSP